MSGLFPFQARRDAKKKAAEQELEKKKMLDEVTPLLGMRSLDVMPSFLPATSFATSIFISFISFALEGMLKFSKKKKKQEGSGIDHLWPEGLCGTDVLTCLQRGFGMMGRESILFFRDISFQVA